MTDFFISYTSPDTSWAEWIGHVLEDAGYRVIVQAWDFRPGSNFVLEMQKAASSAERTILVLSPDYLKSQFAAPEWAAAFASDPQGVAHKLVPIMVRTCQPTGMLKPLVHINLAGHGEKEAEQRLLEGLNAKRAKPSTRPSFPGESKSSRAFPGERGGGDRSTYLPKIKRKASDLEKDEFLEQAFDEIETYFKEAMLKLGAHDQNVQGKLRTEDHAEFVAELFVDGGSKTVCRVWSGDDFMANTICYAEGRRLPQRGTCNEILTLTEDSGELALNATMDMGIRFTGTNVPLDTKNMTIESAADYLWRRFVSHLEV